MARLIPQSARKLRLVYSTACFGASEERQAWEGLGARTVVTHVGINDPLVALPYILSRWIAGAAQRAAERTQRLARQDLGARDRVLDDLLAVSGRGE